MHAGVRSAGSLLWPLLVAMPSPMVAAGTTAIGSPEVLQVPYVAQSEELCGGAAIAMVERWWGRRGVYAEEFASLVRPALGGIRTTDLAEATRARGWRTEVTRGTPALIEGAMRDSVPVIALIRVAPDRYHYVVIVGWDADEVVFHDPAVRPFATLATEAFLERWSGAGRWAMLVRPVPVEPLPVEGHTETFPAEPIDSLPCRPWLDGAVDAVARGLLGEAELSLTAARSACPAEPLVLRELAGLRFRQGHHAEAGRIAATYLRRAPGDSLGWQLLATSRYLTGDDGGALEAWNRIGRPRVDLVRIDGSHRVRFRTIAEAVAITPGTVLTPGRLALAGRRIVDIPALAIGQVSYAVVPDGFVEVRATIVERPLLGSLPRLLVAGVLRGAVSREVELTLATPLGVGERWTIQWRWEDADPRRAARLEIPATVGVPGVLTLETSGTEYHFRAIPPSPAGPTGERRATTLGHRGWLHGNIEALAGVRFERWAVEGDFLALALGAALHGLDDRLVLSARGERATAFAGGGGYARVQLGAGWAAPVRSSGVAWSARLGIDWIGGDAPRGIWPIAGGGSERAIPLRAHPRIVDHLLPTARIGRTIAHGGLSGDRHLATMGPLTLALGLFLDAADVIAAGGGVPRHQYFLDGGVGLRVGLGAGSSTALRIDLARGLLTDRRWGLTVGFQQHWPPRLQHFQ